MSKVKLTKRQADVLGKAVKQYGEDLTIIRHAEKYFHLICEKELLELTTAEVAKALYIGYEVEPKLKIGDWVKNVYNDDVGIVTELGSSYLKYDDGLSDGFHNFRHATPEEAAEEKQLRFWHDNGREIGEFKKNDVIYNKNFGEVDEVTSNQTLPNYEDEYEIICFAHDRKDIKNE